MPRRSTVTLSGRAVDALAVSERDVIVWDRDLAGFGVRVYPTGRKVYVVQSRAGGGPRPRHAGHPRRDHRPPRPASAQPRSSTASSGARNPLRPRPTPAPPPSPTSPSAT